MYGRGKLIDNKSAHRKSYVGQENQKPEYQRLVKEQHNQQHYRLQWHFHKIVEWHCWKYKNE
eukprot:6470965-Amphidinium_carterae.2